MPGNVADIGATYSSFQHLMSSQSQPGTNQTHHVQADSTPLPPKDTPIESEERAAPAEPPKPALPVLRLALSPKLNLADYQNAVPLLRELAVENPGERTFRDLELRIVSEPAFLRARHWHIDAITPGSETRPVDLDIKLDGGLLTRLTESETASVRLSLHGSDGAELAAIDSCVELLPRNHWGGLAQLPDLVAAFVQPNSPPIDKLLKSAAVILRGHGRDDALNGYKGGAKRAWEITSALWSAVGALGLSYALPPASFEQNGQKVRSPAQVVESGLGTCLDLALMFCALIEQAGMHPLLVFTRGHAFAGLWLRPEEFSTVSVDDPTALRKRLQLGELMLFETTYATQHPLPGFSQAAAQGERQVAEEVDGDFLFAIDIRRARLQRIQPLASGEGQPQSRSATEGSGEAVTGTLEPPPESLTGETCSGGDETATLEPKDRIARWQRKLLDLSLRNNLLNFRAGKKMLVLDAPDAGAIEDLLATGKALRLLARPELMDGNDPRSRALHEGRTHENLIVEHAREALQRLEVFVNATASDLEGSLVEIYRAARTTLQEGGANTLFLALGFLSWTQADATGKAGARKYRAPLVLLPVTLERKSVRSGFSLRLHDDEPRFNPTLIEMLRQDFKLSLPGLDCAELPRDQAGLDIAAIWRGVALAVRDIAGWEVTGDVVLAMFSFAKYLMWKDLVERTDQLRESPVVRHLIDTPREGYGSGGVFPEPRRLDADFPPQEVFCPLPADSSQLAAVLAAARGKDFVLIGPPGTGKSQTIANLIAQCLAEGKRVLFVSEKIAALDVVHRRLREVGLGEFCLELHSNKARKLDVLDQLRRAWSARGHTDGDAWAAEARRLAGLRQSLNLYVERLHLRHANGLTVHAAIGHVVKLADKPSLCFHWASSDTHDAEAMRNLRELVDDIAVNARSVGVESLRNGPLANVGVTDWSPSWQQSLMTSSREVAAAATDAEEAARQFCDRAGIAPPSLTRAGRGALARLARLLPRAAGHDWRFTLRDDADVLVRRLTDGLALLDKHQALNTRLSTSWPEPLLHEVRKGLDLLDRHDNARAALARPWPAQVVADLEHGLDLLAQIAEARGGLSVRYAETVEQLNLAQVQRDWTAALGSFWPLSSMRKKKVISTLEAVAADGGTPDPARDLPLLARLRSLSADVAAIDPGPVVAGVWSGLRTRVAIVQTALRLNTALAAARDGAVCDLSGLEAAADGGCGEALREQHSRLAELLRLRQAIDAMTGLTASTDGLWQGVATTAPTLQAALDFQIASQPLRANGRGRLAGIHEAIARGDAGATMARDHQTLRERSTVEDAIAALDDLGTHTAGLWQGLDTSLDTARRALAFRVQLTEILPTLADAPSTLGGLVAALTHLLGDGNTLLAANGELARAGDHAAARIEALEPLLDNFMRIAAFDETARTAETVLSCEALAARANRVLTAEARCRIWCGWRKARQQALAHGLAPLVTAIETGAVAPAAARDRFEGEYARWWLNTVVEREPVIRGFVSAVHEQRIADFRELDRRFVELTRDWLRARLCGELPEPDGKQLGESWGLLRREMSKKTRHLPLRTLIAGIPDALARLAPCLLMSPLSIAQFLPAVATPFDLVVFDEASQIPVWDAIGAMARGRQVVMVGDPKQLPPTNFFGRASGEDEEDVTDDATAVDDLESILDECLGANLPTRNLNWHYRSRSEALIAFSNHRYYGGELVTFPSPATDDRAVSFHYISEGRYAKGGARNNVAEAKALVADLVARLRSPGFRDSGLTIGVVTFNTEQMTLIEDLLDEERRRDPSIEHHFSDAILEPVFVKNLESVQGDERDIMYFSITYGPDAAGRVSMNFGPMNRDGGERRLNVAITRARHELRVFSTLLGEQMDLTRTRAAGVRDLKHFLEFAERGTRALAAATPGSLGGHDSPFEEAVATALAARGWTLHTQVGASAFRIDLAVVDPDAPGRYLAGVECDGATYHRSATARDRDLLREQVLRGLGWEILRIWSTDWWTDPVGTCDRVDGQLRLLHEAARARHDAEVLAPAEAAPPTEDACDLPTKPPAETSSPDAEAPATSAPAVTGELFARAGSAAQPSGFLAYRESDPVSVGAVDAAAFYLPSYDALLEQMVAHVVEVESPILGDVLVARVAHAHGFGRIGRLIRERVLAMARRHARVTTEASGEVFWRVDQDPSAPLIFRTSAGEAGRPVHDVCDAELHALARAVIAGGDNGEAAITRMAQYLGVKRLASATRERLETALRAITRD